jgi:D-glycero-D-manno-heptose 1,7-bisphosphate phosphatase
VTTLRPAVLFDRDGTLNRERSDYVRSWSQFEFVPGALDSLRVVATLDVPILVVTNQSAVGRGLMTLKALADVHSRMCAAVTAAGGRIDAVYICPHTPDEGCPCRKPRVGLLRRAALERSLDLRRSVLIGNSEVDQAAARALGCASVIVDERAGAPPPGWLLPGTSFAGNLARAATVTAGILDLKLAAPPAGFEPATHGLGNRRSIP